MVEEYFCAQLDVDSETDTADLSDDDSELESELPLDKVVGESVQEAYACDETVSLL